MKLKRNKYDKYSPDDFSVIIERREIGRISEVNGNYEYREGRVLTYAEEHKIDRLIEKLNRKVKRK